MAKQLNCFAMFYFLPANAAFYIDNTGLKTWVLQKQLSQRDNPHRIIITLRWWVFDCSGIQRYNQLSNPQRKGVVDIATTSRGTKGCKIPAHKQTELYEYTREKSHVFRLKFAKISPNIY